MWRILISFGASPIACAVLPKRACCCSGLMRQEYALASKTVGTKAKRGVSDCIETPCSFVVNSFNECSGQPSIHGRTRYSCHLFCNSEYASEALKKAFTTIRQDRSGQGSLPCSRLPRSHGQTSPARPHFRILQPGRGVRSLNRKSDRHECRST